MKTIEALVNGQVVASVSSSRWELSLNHIINYVSMYEETENVDLRVFNSEEEVNITEQLTDLVDELLYDKAQEEVSDAFSNNDFVKWQKDRESMLSEISALKGEVRYWQAQAMGSGNRD